MFVSQNLSIALPDNIEVNKTVKLIICWSRIYVFMVSL